MKRVIKLAVIFIALQLVCSLVAEMCVLIPKWSEFMAAASQGNIGESLIQEVVGEMIVPMAIATIVSGVLMVWYLLHTRQASLTRHTFAEVPNRLKWLCLPFVLGAMFTCNLLTDACDLPNVTGELFTQMSHSGWGFLAMVVVAPIVEEVLFRGAMEEHLLRQGKSPRMAIFLSALVFGIIHFNPAQSLFAFLLGLAFGWLYYRTRSVIPGIIGHMLNNAICAVLMLCTSESTDQTFVEHFGKPTYFTCLALALLALGYGYILVKRNTTPPSEETPLKEAAS
jgi:hypothetical protein